MTKQKVGLVVFWISVIWMIAWLVIAKGIFGPLAYSLTTEEINHTIWAFTGPLNILSGVSPLFGALIAGIGISLYAGVKGSTVWKVGIGLVIVLTIALVATAFNFLFRSGVWHRRILDLAVVHRDTLAVGERTHGFEGVPRNCC